MTALLDMWTLFWSPLDWPGHWVLRRFEVGEGTVTPTEPAYVFDDREQAEAWMAQEHQSFGFCERNPLDHSTIIGTYICSHSPQSHSQTVH